jgi:putative ABC transport system ATP-binding protein
MSLISKPVNGNGKDGSPIIDLRDVHKYYKTAVGDFHALNSIDLQINPAEFVSIIGKSGSGKSTLLNMVTGIDRPTSGEVYVNGTAVHELGENDMARWRGRNLGIVFQFFQLLPTISVIENIMLHGFLPHVSHAPARKRALELLELVELAEHAYKLLYISSGQQQRRHCVPSQRSAVVIIDEPTSNSNSRPRTVSLNCSQPGDPGQDHHRRYPRQRTGQAH